MGKLIIRSEDDIEEARENAERESRTEGRAAAVHSLDDRVADETEEAEQDAERMEPYEAYIRCMQKNGRPDMQFLMAHTGCTVKELAEKLDLYQDPVRYDLHREEDQDWFPFSTYICNQHIPRLYKEAKEMEEKYPGRFARNIGALEAHYPKLAALTAFDLVPGSRMVPDWLYEEIFREILEVYAGPFVRYNTDTQRYSIHFTLKPEYVVDHVTYGTAKKGITQAIPALMNGDEIEVRDQIFTGQGMRFRYEKNEKETVALLDKVKRFVERYYEVLTRRLAEPEVYEEISRRYCDTIGGYFKSQVHCDWVSVPGLDNVLRDYQKDGIGCAVMNPVTFFAWGTGAGKSLGMLASAAEMKRLGICRKILMVIPNSSLENFTLEIEKYFPSGKYLIIYPTRFVQKKRYYLDLIREQGDDYDAVIMAVSSYMLLDMSKAYYLAENEKAIRSTRVALNTELKGRNRSTEDAGILKRRLKVLEKQRETLENRPERPTDCFDQLGFDALFSDECQEFKNVSLKCGYTHITGVTTNGSPKCDRHMEKVHWILRGTDASEGRVVFATATPQKNSISETYVWQKYLSETELSYAGMNSFQEWMKNFTEAETKPGVAQDLQSMSLQTRLKYHNLTDLHGMMSGFMNYYHVDQGSLKLPGHGPYREVVIPATPDEISLFEGIAERLKDWHDGLLTSEEYNPLKATIEGRAASSDPRLLEPKLAPAPGTTKAEWCSREVFNIWKAYPGTTQVVFCDLSVPKEGFNLYDEMKCHMVRLGIPAGEIAFIHDAQSPAAMRRLLDAFQCGRIRVLIGSTRKMGIGLNIHRKLKAVHHFDCPYSPSDLIQRNGRAIREGNENDEVLLLRYIKEHSYDAVSWDRVEMKQGWIEAFNSPLMTEQHRNMDDLADNSLSYGEAVAYALGKPEMRHFVETENELKRMLIASRNRAKELQELKTLAADIPEDIAKRERYITIIEGDIAHYRKKKEPMTDQSRRDFGGRLLEMLARAADGLDMSGVFLPYQGFRIFVPARKPGEEPFVKVCGVGGGAYKVKMDTDKPVGCCQILNNYLGVQLEKIRDRHERKCLSGRANIRHAWAEIEKGNPYIRRVEELRKELARLEKELEM